MGQDAADPHAWGVLPGFTDAAGGWRPTPPDTVAALLASLDADASRPPTEAGPLVVRGGRRRRLPRPAQVRLEDGTDLGVVAELPADLPWGYHSLIEEDTVRLLVVGPGRCYLPAALRTWGLAVQLYALRSRRSWGIGDFADLRELGRWAAQLGAGCLLVNPLHAPAPTVPQQPSPYYPSSRRFLNPLYLRIEEVAGAHLLESDLEPLVRAGRALTRERLIDHDAVFRLKLDALERLWTRTRAAEPPTVEPDSESGDFATYCALAETYGADWRTWPPPLRHPRGAAVARFRRAHRHRVAFFTWVQDLCAEQLAKAATAFPLVADLAVGVDPGGADAWIWQELCAPGLSIGAPPDPFAPAGQDWGLCVFHPWRLRAAGYAPVVSTLRAAMRWATGVRVDHVMGLFRLFCIPRGATPRDGGYLRYPADDLLDILALESARAGVFVCGEDLGTVEPTMRAELRRRHVLSYRVLWLEQRDPSRFPRQAVAAVSTHDLPTIAGLWTGSDLAAQRSCGVEANEVAWEGVRRRLARRCHLAVDAPVEDVIVAAYAALSRAPSAVLLASLDDCLAVAERPNMPGTVESWPNWRLALPAILEELIASPLPHRIAAELQRGLEGRRALGRPAR